MKKYTILAVCFLLVVISFASAMLFDPIRHYVYIPMADGKYFVLYRWSERFDGWAYTAEEEGHKSHREEIWLRQIARIDNIYVIRFNPGKPMSDQQPATVPQDTDERPWLTKDGSKSRYFIINAQTGKGIILRSLDAMPFPVEREAWMSVQQYNKTFREEFLSRHGGQLSEDEKRRDYFDRFIQRKELNRSIELVDSVDKVLGEGKHD